MPKRFRPYGSAVDAESAALARGRPIPGGEPALDPAATLTVREIASQAAEATRALNELTSGGTPFASLDDVREVIASLERMGQDLPQLCEQLARILVVQREDGQITHAPGPNWVIEAVEALAAASQAADMMTAALTQASETSAQLRPTRLPGGGGAEGWGGPGGVVELGVGVPGSGVGLVGEEGGDPGVGCSRDYRDGVAGFEAVGAVDRDVGEGEGVFALGVLGDLHDLVEGGDVAVALGRVAGQLDRLAGVEAADVDVEGDLGAVIAELDPGDLA
jgi:hypothetical protein